MKAISSQKHFLILLFLIAVIFTSCSEKKQPNIVFILVDDLGWADIEPLNPSSFYDTPHLNKIAKEGILFTNAYAANPVCSPTRAAIMTGKHPNRVNITDWIPGQNPKNQKLLGPQDGSKLDLEEVTIAEALKEDGYKTCFIGKWHLGSEGFYPENQGFDINIGGFHRGSPVGGYYSPYKNPKLADGNEGEYLTDRLTDEGIKYLKQNKNSPLFLFMSYYTVHTPIQACLEYFDKFKEKRETMKFGEIPYRIEGEGKTRLLQENVAFASMVAAMDNNIGRLINTLKSEEIYENTWIIITSDNGGLSTLRRGMGPSSNEPLRAGKGWCYEGGIRVPAIILGPGIKNKGTTSDFPIVSMDYFPTILKLAGIEDKISDGKNLLPLLKGKEEKQRDAIFWHYPHYHGSAWKPGSALRLGDWKIVVHYEDDKTELFNLKNDLSETTDLSSIYPEKVSELKAILDKKLAESNAQFPVKNPNYKPVQE